MVYGFQIIVFFALVVFILQIKKRYFSKYEHLFFNRIKIYLWFFNVMVFNVFILRMKKHYFSKYQHFFSIKFFQNLKKNVFILF